MVLLGETGVGKSSLVLRLVKNAFMPFSESTIGASFLSKVIEVDEQTIKLQIWDTAGQERYHSLSALYYRGSAAAVVVFDLTRAESFDTLQKWVKELKEKGPKGIAIFLAGNKKDLEEQRQVDATKAQAYADSIDAGYIEVSAKDDIHVQDLFKNLCRLVPKPSQEELEASGGGGRRGIYLTSMQQRSQQASGGNNGGKTACCS